MASNRNELATGKRPKGSAAASRLPAARPANVRASTSNGTRLLAGDGRSLWARRFHDLVASHAADLGGADHLSEAQIALIRRAATLECELELREASLAGGSLCDLDEFARVSSHLRRLWETLGLHRASSDVTPKLAQIVAAHKAAKPVDGESTPATSVAAQPVSCSHACPAFAEDASL